MNAPKKTFVLFAQIAGKRNRTIDIEATIVCNNPGLPKLVLGVSKPVKVDCIEGIYAHGKKQAIISVRPAITPR